jgi:hypothetical protein
LSWLEQSAEENYSTNQLQQSFVSVAANYHKEPTKIKWQIRRARD